MTGDTIPTTGRNISDSAARQSTSTVSVSYSSVLTNSRHGVAKATIFIMTLVSMMLFGSQTFLPAYAAETSNDTAAMTIEADWRDATSFALIVTNTDDQDVESASGTTSVPEAIVADGQPTTVQWQVNELQSGASTVAQTMPSSDNEGTTEDLIVHVKAGASDDADAANITVVTNANKKPKQSNLAATGAPIIGFALVALGALCLGTTLRYRKGSVIVQRSVAVLGVVAMAAGIVSMTAPRASAATHDSADIRAIQTTISYDEKEYQLSSDVHITYMATEPTDPVEPTKPLTSLEYAKAMGAGWNLGNSFEAIDTGSTPEENGGGETAWGNPVVTPELIQSIKDKGFDSIRMPMTVDYRFVENEAAGEGEYRYVVKDDWLKRYKQVVDWAVDDGLYVLINMHNDSWLWLNQWDGTELQANTEYRMYTEFWKQIAQTFADEPAQVSFETLNEPQFDSGDEDGVTKITKLNQAAYDSIRSISGNEQRMIVMPTLHTNDGDQYTQPLRDQILGLNDPNIIATVHYYSQWVYSANLGRTGFDEDLFGDGETARTSADLFAQHIADNFTANGIGTVVGEYGLLGYDSADSYLQPGEELKYYEYMNHLAHDGGYSLMFWDNGSGIDRHSASYAWKDAKIGTMIEASMTSRSSYATGLDTVYLGSEPTAAITIPLTLNGNTFVGIEGLREGEDYTYDAVTSSLALSATYLSAVYDQLDDYGQVADIVMNFSSGAPWHQYLIRSDAPTLDESAGSATGSQDSGMSVPVAFNGNIVKSATAFQTADGAERRVGPNSDWWEFLQYGGSFTADYSANTFTLLPSFFSDPSVTDGDMRVHLTFFDGSELDILLNVSGGDVTVRQ